MRHFQWQGLVGAMAVAALVLFTASANAQRHHPPRPMGPGMMRPPMPMKPGMPMGPRMRGQVIRILGPDRFVVRTPDNREMILRTDAQTRFLMNQGAARFSDLRERSNVLVRFNRARGRNLARSVLINPRLGASLGARSLAGTIARLNVLDDLMVVRTASGREVPMHVNSRTALSLNNQTVLLNELRTGMPVQIQFDVRDQRNLAQSIAAMPG